MNKKATEDQFNELHNLVTKEFLSRIKAGEATTQDLKAAAVGEPLEPTFLIFSPEPALIRFLLACMFAYNPLFAAMLALPFA